MMTALNGEVPDCVPVMPEVLQWTSYHLGFDMFDITQGIEKYVFSQYYWVRKYGYDAVQNLIGINAVSEAMGSKLKFFKQEPPAVIEYAVKDYTKDLGKLKVVNPNKDGRLPIVLGVVRRLKELCQGEILVNAWLRGPFFLASRLRGEDIYRDMLRNKNNLHHLLEITTYNQIIFGTALIQAGADTITIADPTSSGDIISRQLWEEFGFIYTKRLVKELKKNKIKTILHICGDTSEMLDTFVNLSIDAISLEEKVDLAFAREKVGNKVCLLGNVDPINLKDNTVEEIKEESRKCIEKGGKEGNFILMSGCAIPQTAPPENIKAMVDVAHGYKYNQN